MHACLPLDMQYYASSLFLFVFCIHRSAVVVYRGGDPVPHPALRGRGSDDSGAVPLLQCHEQTEAQCLCCHVHCPVR